MSQQINLLNARFRKEKRYLTAPALAIIVGAALVCSLAVAVSVRGRVATLQREADDVQAKLAAGETRKTAVLGGLVPRTKDATVEQQLARAEVEHQALRNVTDILEQNRVGDPAGYSAYFQALARSRVNGLWLTGVQVDGTAADIGLRGRALRAELLPGYLRGLAREPALAGKAFGQVEITRPAPYPQESVPTAAAAPPAQAPAVAAASQVLAQLGIGAPAAAASPPPAVPSTPAAPVMVTPPYIEFSLQSAGAKKVEVLR